MTDENEGSVDLTEVESLEAVPEPFRTFYEEQDGKFVLQDISGLKNAAGHKTRERDQARKKAKALEEKLKAFEGIDPEEYKAWKEREAQKEEEEAAKEGNFEKIKAKLQKEIEDIKTNAAKEIAELQHSFDRQTHKREISDALMSAGVTEEGTKLLPLQLLERSAMRDVDGERKAVMVDKDGDPLLDSSGNALTVTQWAKTQLGDEFPSLVKASGRSGGGASQSNGGGAGRRLTPELVGKMSAMEKAMLISENPEAWKAYEQSLGVQEKAS